ncbi:hypothetical protein AAHA92_30572 [Salvia divinorum]|uniref:Uncharacterized protein n=1 Tax=Salvia divinorum TaxID=28513 RepID=A0ABD1FRB2_SALDI
MEPSVSAVPYETARVFRSPFGYIFPLSGGQKFLRLYLHPNVYSDVDTSHLSSLSVPMASPCLQTAVLTFIPRV